MDIRELLKKDSEKELLRFVAVGSVDDGKSTLIGRLLYESKAVYEDELAAVSKASEGRSAAGEEIDLAFITDGLKLEREQGITIDVAYRYFATPRRKFIIADTPGHELYTRNMVTGASTADLALLLVDARNGIVTQTRRHTFIASLLRISHLLVAVNKMDLVEYREEVFEAIRKELIEFSAKLRIPDIVCIPVSALKGDNVVEPSPRMPWYKGATVLNHLETLNIASDRNLVDMRFPVQCVVRAQDSFRGYLGTVASGIIRPGDEVVVLPRGLRTRVRSVFDGDGELKEAFPPLAVGVTLEDELDVARGDVLARVGNVPSVDRTIETMIVWMAEEPLREGDTFLVKHRNTTVSATLTSLRYRIDVNTLHRREANELALNEIGRCLLTLSREITYDTYARNRSCGSFIIIDRVTNDTTGAGIILEMVSTEGEETAGRRGESEATAVKAAPVSVTVWITGDGRPERARLAESLERLLLEKKVECYVLSAPASSAEEEAGESAERVLRTARAAAALNRAGFTAICTDAFPSEETRREAERITGRDRFFEVRLRSAASPRESAREILNELEERGFFIPGGPS